jgi:hypothetical protein
VAEPAKKCRRSLATLSPKRHRGDAGGESLAADSRDSRRIRSTEVLAHGHFPKKFFTGDSARSEHLGEASAMQLARCPAACSAVAKQMPTLQNPLWNRGFEHFQEIRTRSLARCGGRRERLRAVDRARTTGSVLGVAYTLR